jgi:hypothetical protein
VSVPPLLSPFPPAIEARGLKTAIRLSGFDCCLIRNRNVERPHVAAALHKRDDCPLARGAVTTALDKFAA